MRALRAAGVAVVVGGLLFLMLDSGAVTPERAPRVVSVSLAALGALFGLGAWATSVGGRPERAPLFAGLAAGLLGYAVARLLR
ncbi:MAG TPA: hypothetical protein VFD84_03960 [Candidatus Binatia bacterium]|nr:hypothetical protein [Candidatus Binatia bacterium]